MQSVTSKDLNEALLEKGIIMDKHRLSYHIRFNELNGTFCSGNLLPTKATYSLTEKKVPRTARLERDEMLMLLARKYFQSHSPATFEDYVWWSGLSTFFPVIAHDGRICGNWNPWEKNLNISYFDSTEKDLSFEKQWKIFNGTIKKK